MKFYINIHLKKLFDVIYQLSLRKHSAKAFSSGFYNDNVVVRVGWYPWYLYITIKYPLFKKLWVKSLITIRVF